MLKQQGKKQILFICIWFFLYSYQSLTLILSGGRGGGGGNIAVRYVVMVISSNLFVIEISKKIENVPALSKFNSRIIRVYSSRCCKLYLKNIPNLFFLSFFFGSKMAAAHLANLVIDCYILKQWICGRWNHGRFIRWRLLLRHPVY